MNNALARVLIVAGSDPICGAGLQADLKTIGSLGGYGLTAVTAITVQDSQQVFHVQPVDPGLVVAQIQAILADVGADVLKLGMLANPGIVQAVSDLLITIPHLPVVLDPILSGTGGGILLEPGALSLMLTTLIPQVTLLTPNLNEAARLWGNPIHTVTDMEEAARFLAKKGPSVLIKGGHLAGDRIVDVLLGPHGKLHHFAASRIPGQSVHGTGCVLSSAIALRLGQGWGMVRAVEDGIGYVRERIRTAQQLGKGQRLMA